MKKIIMLFIIMSALVRCQTSQEIDRGNLILLKNSEVEVGVIPNIGGRVVILRKPGEDNLIKSDETQWNDPAIVPEASPFSHFKTFNGHIVWLSPQSEWWINQDMNTERRNSKAIWPPDPYLIYGENTILTRTDALITMVGLESPVSGVRVKKTIAVEKDGTVNFQAIATNIRENPVSWGIWLNTRLDGFDRCYVPIENENKVRFAIDEGGQEIPMPYKFMDGYFTFLPQIPADSTEKYVQKAYIQPADQCIIGFHGNQAIEISFKHVNENKIHRDHTAVEIYNLTSLRETLLELEIHGPYEHIQPDEHIQLEEKWRVFTYNGDHTPESHIQFIKEKIRR